MGNQSSFKSTKRGTPGWAWALIVLGALLIILIIVFIIVAVVGDTPSTKPENQVNSITNAIPVNTTTTETTLNTASIDTYLLGVTDVLNKINAAVEYWSAAADAGVAEDIVASNSEVNKGIAEAKVADTLYAALVPTPDTAALHSKLKEALDLTHEALNKALLGNLNEDPATIQKSKDAITALVPALEAVQAEIDAVTKLLPAS